MGSLAIRPNSDIIHWLREHVPYKERVRDHYFALRGYAADARHRFRSSPSQLTATPDAPDHILLVVIDCLRPDYIPDLPLEFTTAIAPSTWTFPSVTSIHTGQYPHEHGTVVHATEGDSTFAIPKQAEGQPVLPEVLEGAGYDTASVAGFVMPYLAYRGWYQRHRVFGHEPVEPVGAAYRDWRRGRSRTFAYLHLSDLHRPLMPPERLLDEYDVDRELAATEAPEPFDSDDPECRRFRENELRRYRATLAHVEETLTPLLEDVLEDTLVVVTADHGETMWEHPEVARQFSNPLSEDGFEHGGTPFDAVARVPVGVSHPGDGSVLPEGGWPSLCDLPRTVVAEVTPEETNPFGKHAWQETIPDDRTVLCEGVRYGHERKAVYGDGVKIIRSIEDDIARTARVDCDRPGETFVELEEQTTNHLLASLPGSWGTGDAPAELSGIVAHQLESLGYK